MRLAVEASARRGSFELEVRLQAEPGILAIVGASGSGKSTLLDVISGELPLESGHILLGERRLDAAPARLRRTVRVYQDGRIFPHLRTRENLRFSPQRSELSFDEVVETLRISTLLERWPHELSGGERQRVALGRALLAGHDALLLDEPLHAIDDALRRRLIAALGTWNRRVARPWLYVTHAVEEAVLLAHSAISLEQGRVVAAGTAAEVLARGVDDPLASSDATDTLLRLRVLSHQPGRGVTLVACGSTQLEAPSLELAVGEEYVAALAARDVVLATERPRALSARNLLPAIVGNILSLRETWRVELNVAPDMPPLLTTVTGAAHRELGLSAGRSVWVVFKSSALRRLL